MTQFDSLQAANSKTRYHTSLQPGSLSGDLGAKFAQIWSAQAQTTASSTAESRADESPPDDAESSGSSAQSDPDQAQHLFVDTLRSQDQLKGSAGAEGLEYMSSPNRGIDHQSSKFLATGAAGEPDLAFSMNDVTPKGDRATIPQNGAGLAAANGDSLMQRGSETRAEHSSVSVRDSTDAKATPVLSTGQRDIHVETASDAPIDTVPSPRDRPQQAGPNQIEPGVKLSNTEVKGLADDTRNEPGRLQSNTFSALTGQLDQRLMPSMYQQSNATQADQMVRLSNGAPYDQLSTALSMSLNANDAAKLSAPQFDDSGTKTERGDATARQALPMLQSNVASPPVSAATMSPLVASPTLVVETALDVPLDPDVAPAPTSQLQLQTSQQVTQSVALNRAHASHVAQQVTAAIVQSSGATTEIMLNPEELGRVRIAMTAGDAGMTVTLFAERPETTDLMRRNIEDLTRELRDMGYDNLTFNFENHHDGSGDAQGENASQSGVVADLPSDEAATVTRQRVVLSGGLDLKL